MEGRPLTYDDFPSLNTLSDVQVSPGGDRAAYLVQTLDRDSDQVRTAIWMLNLTTGETKQFTSGTGGDKQPRWSPDGRWLAFVSARSEDKGQIFVIPAEGGEARQVTRAEEGAHTPAWSPDSEKLAFLVNTASDRQAISWDRAWTQEKPERRAAPQLRRLNHVKYRFDGKGYLDTRTHLFLVHRDGGEAEQLTDGDSEETEPAWSPDGSAIAFVSNRGPDADYSPVTDIWTIDLDTRELRRLTDGSLAATTPAWAPDGSVLAFYATPNFKVHGAQNTHVWQVGRNGEGQRDLMASYDGTMRALLGDYGPLAASPPRWHPDGSAVYVTMSRRGSEIPVTVPLNGGDVQPVWDAPINVQTMDTLPDGRALIVCADSPDHPYDLFRLPLPDGEPERLTEANKDLLRDVRLGKVERLTYAGADGWPMDAWLVRPAVQDETPCPLILHVHGGPHGMYGDTFYFNMQVLAGAGIASMYINPRGSGGYGLEFMRAVMTDWGGKDFEDLMLGVERAVEMGLADPSRLGITGGSYGGFMTNWTLGHTNRFAAGVSINSISNMVSMFGTSDIGLVWFEGEMGGLPWEKPDVYRERSPLTYVTNIQTPLLLLHAENDNRCPIEQGEQIYMALKAQHKVAELVRIPVASHSLANTPLPRHRIARWILSKEWFDRYLGSSKT